MVQELPCDSLNLVLMERASSPISIQLLCNCHVCHPLTLQASRSVLLRPKRIWSAHWPMLRRACKVGTFGGSRQQISAVLAMLGSETSNSSSPHLSPDSLPFPTHSSKLPQSLCRYRYVSPMFTFRRHVPVTSSCATQKKSVQVARRSYYHSDQYKGTSLALFIS